MDGWGHVGTWGSGVFWDEWVKTFYFLKSMIRMLMLLHVDTPDRKTVPYNLIADSFVYVMIISLTKFVFHFWSPN